MIEKLRLLLLDAALTHAVLVTDSALGPRQAYGTRRTSFLPYLHDSSLFVDAAALGVVVVDPNGKMGRTIALARPTDAGYLANSSGFPSGVDQLGRLVYAGPTKHEGGPGSPGHFPIVRLDLVTRDVDTIALLRDTDSWPMTITKDAPNEQTWRTMAKPIQSVDDWALLSDGSVAVIRGDNYHVDWIRLDGSKETSPQIPYPWHRLSDSDKVRLLDSARKAFASDPRTSGTRAEPGGVRITSVYDVVS